MRLLGHARMDRDRGSTFARCPLLPLQTNPVEKRVCYGNRFDGIRACSSERLETANHNTNGRGGSVKLYHSRGRRQAAPGTAILLKRKKRVQRFVMSCILKVQTCLANRL